MKFSIVTPSLNQGNFIEDTIRSVLNQSYNDIEHIIIDGGSSDNTVEILKKYSHLNWISEKDSGQSSALNKGFKLSTGDIAAWINADDYYEPDIFPIIADFFTAHPDCFFLYGDMTYVDEKKVFLTKSTGDRISRKSLLMRPDIVRQPSCFWRTSVFKTSGMIDESLHLVMDYEFFLRISENYKFYYIDKNISFLRMYAETKTQKLLGRQFHELFKIMMSNFSELSPSSFKFLLGRYLDSLDDSKIFKKMLTPLRKEKL